MFARSIRWIVQSSHSFFVPWSLVIIASCVFSLLFLKNLRLDTDIARLLPSDNPVAVWMKSLQKPLGDGGYFTLLLESDNRADLHLAADEINDLTAALPDVAFTTYRNPMKFIEKYKFSLLSSQALEQVYDYTLQMEVEYNPFSANLLQEDLTAKAGKKEISRQNSLEKRLIQVSSIREYHESEDGRFLGIIVYPKSLITELEAVRKLYTQLEVILANTTEKYGVKGDIGGSQIKNLREYTSIIEDLGKAGTIAAGAIFLVLLLCFRSVKIIPIVILPLLVGLAWSFSLVPFFIGPLNIITVFLLLILVGMGIDYSIHLVRNFQMELLERSVPEAMYNTFSTTGKSVLISGLTTALPLFVLAFSRFRGFSEFGFIGGISILSMLLAMFTVLPVLFYMGVRIHLIRAGVTFSGAIQPPSRKTALLLLTLVFASCIYTLYSGQYFDYNFTAHGNSKEALQFDKNHRKVYNSSLVPAALYLAPNHQILSSAISALSKNLEDEESTIKRLTSVQDFAPSETEYKKRLEILSHIRETLKGKWIEKIPDPQKRQWISEFRNWEPPEQPAEITNLPEVIRNYYLSRDGSEQLLLGVYPSVSIRNGKKVIAFQKELEKAPLPEVLKGPVGEGILFAEILSTVLTEAPVVLSIALVVVVLPVLITGRSIRDTMFTLFPLISGMALLFGIMGLAGMQVNYLSVVALPTLLGLGVDDGIHYYRHCKANNYNVETTQNELFGTLSVCTLTTMIGYCSLILAQNRGLQSLGIIASLGMACLWFTSVFLLPGLLRGTVPCKKRPVRLAASNKQLE